MTGPEEPDCPLCDDTGWVTRVDRDGFGYETACPAGCPTVDHDLEMNQEAPF